MASCADVVLVQGAGYSHEPLALGTFTRLEMAHDGRWVFQNDAAHYLYYWAEWSSWRISSDAPARRQLLARTPTLASDVELGLDSAPADGTLVLTSGQLLAATLDKAAATSRSTGALAGIVVGSVVVTLLLLLVCYLVRNKRRVNQANANMLKEMERSSQAVTLERGEQSELGARTTVTDPAPASLLSTRTSSGEGLAEGSASGHFSQR